MKVIILFVVAICCLYHIPVASANQHTNQDDPNKPFWPSRGRRSGRLSIKADDDMLERSEDYGTGMPEVFEKEVRNKQQASSFLSNLLNAIYLWDGEVVRKRNDPKSSSDGQNPFYAARG